jgi:hypothetical protein
VAFFIFAAFFLNAEGSLGIYSPITK